MRHIIDKKTGQVTFIPDCQLDRQLLFHLMDCSDLSEFSMYVQNFPNITNCPMTADLGVPAEELIDYPCPGQPFSYKTDLPEMPVRPVSLYTGDDIGFERKSLITGKLTDEMSDNRYPHVGMKQK